LTSEELPGFDVNVPFFGSASANWKKKGDLGLKGDIEGGA
jgi:hypothetical protein